MDNQELNDWINKREELFKRLENQPTKEKAQELRSKYNYSYLKIAKTLGVSYVGARKWCEEIEK